jgi:tRNA-dihydrouridine synthase B
MKRLDAPRGEGPTPFTRRPPSAPPPQTATPAPNFYARKLAEGRAVLAPMAGFTDAPFRRLCRRFGSGWAVTEMVSAKALVEGNGRGLEIGAPYRGEPDLVIQVFGGEPEVVAEGGRILFERYAPEALDLNMGCPVKKVTGKSCGSRLMQDPERAAAILRALSDAVPVPVSAKLRLGYDTVNALEVALALQEAGAALLTVHGRTALQKYSGEADWDAIAGVAAGLSVPVVGSGDVTTRAQFEHHRAQGLGVMIGRGALGRPWIFAECRGAPPPSERERFELIREHARLAHAWYGSDHAVVKLRGQLLRYAETLSEDAALRDAFRSVSTLEALERLLEPISA